ncbi:hypothetical protein BC826DRAFT_257869 [Russula brevipes]|nr:hypothetical protein BC826DRAFT_257869 [Russula brevipes]
MGYLRDSQPETYCYQSFDYDGSSKADARVRVAMSKRGYKSSPPEDITLSTSGASRTSRSSPTHSTYGIGSLIGRMALLLSGAVTPVVASSSTQPSEEAPSSTVMEPERSRTSQSVEPRASSSSSSAISHIPRKPHVSLGASDLLIDGYISETFSPRVAVIYVACVFKVEPTRLRTFTHECRPGVFFASNPPTDHSRPPITLNGRPAWVLDYVIRFGGSVIPHQLWPHKLDDFLRSVGQASLHLPVFFLNMDGNLGVPVMNAAAGQMSLDAAHEPAPLGGGYTTKIRICWPGYRPSEQQIQLRDQTPAHNPILRKVCQASGKSRATIFSGL